MIGAGNVGRLAWPACVCALAALIGWLGSFPAQATVSVLQRGYTPGVVNANLQETVLTPANVGPSTFGRIFSLPVDGRIYAQPLFVPGLTIPGKGKHNVLFVATMRDSIYAFDAETPIAPLWAVNYANLIPGAAPVSIVDYVGTDSYNIAGPVGIESTPVIDSTTGTMYFVTNTRESDVLVFRLHAINILTGAELSGSPMVIQGTYTVPGRTLTFTPNVQNQRPSLTLAKGQVIVCFASHEDFYQYFGWVMAYDETTLAQTAIFVTTPLDDHGGGVWQSGRPPAVDTSGDVYLFVGNSWAAGGSSNTWDGVYNFTESVLRLDPGQGLKLIDYFTPANYAGLDSADLDMTSSGPTLIPDTNVLAGGGKFGTIYLLNTQNLGQLQANDAGALQPAAVSNGEIRGGPAYWQRSTAAGGPLLYNWGATDALKAFAFTGSAITTTPVAQFAAPADLYPGGELTVSSSGDNNGIVWALIVGQGDGEERVPPGMLMALNAADVSQELWDSNMNATRDDFGLLAKFVPPTVANGKVYVATSSNQVVVYGLLPAAGIAVTAWPPQQFALGGGADYVVSALSASGVPQAATWSVLSGLPAGATATFTTDAQGQTVLQVALGAQTPRGSHRLRIQATVGAASATQSVLFEVPDGTPVVAVAASADSADPSGPASLAIDGNPATFWVTPLSGTPGFPHEITVDLGSVQPVAGLSYLPRQDGCITGTMMQYEVHLSVDNVNWLPETTGGSFNYGPQWHTYNCSGTTFMLPKPQAISFPVTNARYVQLVGLGAVEDGTPWASAAEIQVFTAQNQVPWNGPHVLAVRETDMVLSVVGTGTGKGAGMVQEPYANAGNQIWKLWSSSWPGYSRLDSSGSNLLLQEGPVASSTATVTQRAGDGKENEAFLLAPYGDGRGYFAVQSLSTGYCVDVYNSATTSGATVGSEPCSYGVNQLWFVTPSSATVP